jgi:prolipoprotein diacylglyceryltransferase
MLDGGGGLVVGALAGLVYGQRKHMPLWPTLDALTPALAILAVGLGLAHLASGNAFGAPTRLPWGIDLWGEKRHPSQVYEIMAALAILALVWPRPAQDETWPPGARFLAFIALSAFARLFLEAFRGDSTLLVGSLRTAQVAAWLVLAAALWAIGKRRLHGKPRSHTVPAPLPPRREGQENL